MLYCCGRLVVIDAVKVAPVVNLCVCNNAIIGWCLTLSCKGFHITTIYHVLHVIEKMLICGFSFNARATRCIKNTQKIVCNVHEITTVIVVIND